MRVRAMLVPSLAFAVLAVACGDDSDVGQPAASTPSPVTAAPASDGLAAGSFSTGLGRGDPAPSFDAELLSGSELTLVSLRGKPVVLNFWLTTCTPCIREMPALAELMRLHEADELVVVGVNSGESSEVVTEFIANFEVDLDFPIVMDRQSELREVYEIVVFPMTYFIDRDGIVQYRRVGELREDHIAVGLERIL